jgi:hypothetical protein
LLCVQHSDGSLFSLLGAQLLAVEGKEDKSRHFVFTITPAAAALSAEPLASLVLKRRSDVLGFLQACIGGASAALHHSTPDADAAPSAAPTSAQLPDAPAATTPIVAAGVDAGGDADAGLPAQGGSLTEHAADGAPPSGAPGSGIAPAAQTAHTSSEPASNALLMSRLHALVAQLPEAPAAMPSTDGAGGSADGMAALHTTDAGGAIAVRAYDSWRMESRRQQDQLRVLSFFLRNAVSGAEARACMCCRLRADCSRRVLTAVVCFSSLVRFRSTAARCGGHRV